MNGEISGKHGPFECVAARYEKLKRRGLQPPGTHHYQEHTIEGVRIREIFPYGPRKSHMKTPQEILLESDN